MEARAKLLEHHVRPQGALHAHGIPVSWPIAIFSETTTDSFFGCMGIAMCSSDLSPCPLGNGSGNRVLVLVLTFNEADNLPRLLDRIAGAMPSADVLVIDDNSPDGTGRRASDIARDNARLTVIIRRNKRGLGSALCKGIEYAIVKRYDFLLNLDADFSHNPADLPRLLNAATSDGSTIDVVIGSRYVEAGSIEGWSLRRRAMSRLVNGFATLVLRLPVRDCSGALRCYRVEALGKIDLSLLRSNGYSIQEEVLLSLRSSGATMKEVPIIFVDRQRGQSKLTSWEALCSAWRLMCMATR